MASSGSLTIRPGSPDTPEFVDIDCSGLDDTKTIELVINGIVRATIPVDITGNVILSYVVPAGSIRNALLDINYASGNMAIVNSNGIISGIKTNDGDDSLILRYQL